MGKLTGAALKYVAENLKTCKKYSLDKRAMYVEVNDKSTGQRVCRYLMSATGAKGYSTILGSWGDFILTYEKVWQRDQAVLDVNSAIDEYIEAHADDTPLSPLTQEDETVVTEVYEEENASGNNMVTYIIIGAAAIIIALLLWKAK